MMCTMVEMAKSVVLSRSFKRTNRARHTHTLKQRRGRESVTCPIALRRDAPCHGQSEESIDLAAESKLRSIENLIDVSW